MTEERVLHCLMPFKYPHIRWKLPGPTWSEGKRIPRQIPEFATLSRIKRIALVGLLFGGGVGSALILRNGIRSWIQNAQPAKEVQP